MAVIKNISLPDIGNFHHVEVIEIMVKPGDSIQVNDALLALESDKAAMEIPASDAGVVKEVLIKIGDKISQGDLILTLEVADATSLPAESTPVIGGAAPPSVAPPPSRTVELSPPPAPVTAVKQPPLPRSSELPTVSKAHASPSVRRFARELGATLDGIAGSGAKGRILKEDVQAFVKAELSQRRSGTRRRFQPARNAGDRFCAIWRDRNPSLLAHQKTLRPGFAPQLAAYSACHPI